MMKKLLLIFCLLLGQIGLSHPFVQAATADTISFRQAQDLAAYFHALTSGETSYKADQATLVQRVSNPVQGAPVAYYFNIDQGGWVILSGSTVSHPVIAYSEYGTLDPANYSPAMESWMADYCQMIVDAQNRQVEPTEDIYKEWNTLFSHSLDPFPQSKDQQWLVATQWNQSNPYNFYCPVLGGQHCLVGCVATAMAQVVRYYQFPTIGKSSKSYREPYTIDGDNTVYYRPPVSINFSQTYYDYANMPSVLTSSSDSVEIKATALLCFHLGVAVDMEYGTTGSAAYHDAVATAMRRYFKYKQGTPRYRSEFSDQEWMDTLGSEIRAHRPVLYSAASSIGDGRDAAGHQFICDGINPSQSNLFHFNWGWGGYCDGWFDMSTINGLDPSSYNFCLRQFGLFGVEPPNDSNRYVGVHTTDITAEALPAYPNPAFSTITIPYTLQGVAQSSLQIFDITGKMVQEVRVEEGSNEATINVLNYPQGIYLYRLKGGKSHKFLVR